MRYRRALLIVGTVCLLVAGGNLIVGSSTEPLLTVFAAVLGSIALVVALVTRRDEADPPAPHDPERSERLVRIVTYGLAGLGLLAFLVALVVAEGEARGHAVSHLLSGLLCLGLFAALAFLWHPRTGGTASFRGFVLMLLAVAALGALLESLGGAGYDAANAGRRIELLTTLHNIVTPLGALLLIAVPLAVITGISVLIARVIRRDRIRPTP